MAEMTPQNLQEIYALIDEMNRQRVTGQAMPDPRLSFAGPAPSTAQNLMDAMAMPAQEFVAQAGRAGTSLADAQSDPTLANITNAGVQSAMALGRPVAAAGAGGLGLLEAIRRDVMGGGGAQAQSFLTPDQQAELKKDLAKLDAKQYSSGAQRRIIEDNIKRLRKMDADLSSQKASNDEAQRAAQLANEETQRAADAQRKSDEDAAARQRAGQAYHAGLATDRRFSDTEVGKIFDKFGPVAPGVAAGGAGLLSGLGVRGGGITNNVARYGIPTGIGALTGTVAANWPQIYEANYAPNVNPSHQAASNYVREAPPDDPRAAQLSQLMQSGAIKESNPVRTEARQSLYDPKQLAERSVMGLLEGVAGGFAGGEVPSAAKYMLKSLPKAAEEVGKVPGSLWRGLKAGFSDGPRNPAGASPRATVANVAGQGQAGIPPNVPAGPLANTQGNYPKLGTPERGYIRDEYRGAVLDAGGPLDPRAASRTIQSAAENQGGKLRGMEARITETNNNIKAFEAQHGRLPISKKEFEDFIFKNTKTLGLLGAMGLGSALSQPTE